MSSIQLLNRSRLIARKVEYSIRSIAGLQQPKNILLVECYDRKGREEFLENNVPIASNLFAKIITNYNNGVYLHSSGMGKKFNYQTIYPADGDKDFDLNDFDATVWTGSSLTVYDDKPEVTKQIDLMSKIIEHGLPVYGSCWGMQVASVANGGKCSLADNGREMGPCEIHLTDAGLLHPMYEGKIGGVDKRGRGRGLGGRSFRGFESHNDEVCEVPKNGTVLATNGHTRVQAMELIIDNGLTKVPIWGTQYHIEYDFMDFALLVKCRKEKLIKIGFFKDDLEFEQYLQKLKIIHYHNNTPYEYQDINCEKLKGVKNNKSITKISNRTAEFINWLDMVSANSND